MARGRKQRPLSAEVVEAFITSRMALGGSCSYREWLRYHLGFLVRTWSRLPAGAEEIELVLSRVKRRRPGPPELSDVTRRNVWRSLRMLYAFAVRRYGVRDAMLGVGRVPLRVREPVILEVREMLWALDVNKRYGRDYAALRLLVDTGARVGELCGLRQRDVGEGFVRLSGKTGERRVPVTAETQRALQAVGDGANVFIGRRGPLTVGGLQKVVRRALKRAGLSGGPHMLRHSFGVAFVEAGGELMFVKEMLGHRRIQTTERYVQAAKRRLAREHAKFSPVSGVGDGLQLRLLEDVG